MMTAHKIRLSPNATQATALAQQVGYARFGYNHALADFRELLELGQFLGEKNLRKRWNAVKDEIAPWHNDKTDGGKKILCEYAPKNAIIDLGKAIKAWNDYCQKKKKGVATRRVGFPRFRKRGGSGDGWRASNGRGHIRTDGRRVKLPMIGWVKMTEEFRFLAAVIAEVTVSRRAGKWFISFSCVVAEPEKPDLSGRPEAAIDVGERRLATILYSDGKVETIENPRPLERELAKLRWAQKAVSRKKKGSKNRERAKLRVEKIHYRVACIRQDNIHKATSALAKTAGRIVVEDLGVARMAKRRGKKNARGLYDAGMAEFLRILKYKAERVGIPVDSVDPAYTSKTCAACGHVNRALGSAERWTCPQCGARHHRDVNAAAVLEQRGKDKRTGSSPGLARGDGVRRPIAAATVREARTEGKDQNC